MRISAVGKYPKICEDFGGKYQRMWKEYLLANIKEKYQQAGTRRECDARKLSDARTTGGARIEWFVRRSVGKYHKICEDLLWANISTRARICGQISPDVKRYMGKFKQMCKDLLANISTRAKNYCGQISEDGQIFLYKYKQTCKDLRANIIIHARQRPKNLKLSG